MGGLVYREMTNYRQRIAFVSTDVATGLEDPWVKLEQTKPSKIAQAVTMREIYRMWMMAAQGQSARRMRSAGCPIEFIGSQIHIYLGFQAWPSTPEMSFDLQASTGKIINRKNIEKQREFSVFVENVTNVKLPYYMRDISLHWETPCFNRYGEQIDAPTITLAPTEISFDSEVFGGLRITGTALGVSAIAHITIDKPITEDDSLYDPHATGATTIYQSGVYSTTKPKPANLNSTKIEAPSCTITASWQGLTETKTDQLRLEVPQCVIDALNMCPGMWDKFAEFCWEQKKITVYFDGCTGEQKHSKIGYDGRSYCSKIEVVDRPWWYPEDFYDQPNT